MKTGVSSSLLLTLLGFLAGCHSDMRDQPRYDTFEASDFFGDGLSARPLIPGTVPRGALKENEALNTGREKGQLLAQIPLTIDRALLERGRQRFDIFCAVCHAPTGTGNGMVVQRGFRQPPSYHIDRLRQAPAGHFFDVISHGFGTMPSYAVQIEPQDRWAIVSYIRALQFSQNASLKDLPLDEQRRLKENVP